MNLFHRFHWDSGVDIEFLLRVHNIDVVQIIEVFTVKTTKNEHAASQETGAMSSPGFRNLSLDLSCGYLVLLRVEDQDIVEIIAEATPEDINLVIVDC